MTIQFTTRDVGLAIRDNLEQAQVHHFVEGEGVGGEFVHIEDGREFVSREIVDVIAVDVSDPSNIIIQLDNGQCFTCRIVTRV